MGGMDMVEEMPPEGGQGELVVCTGCSRSFNPKAMKVHKKICKKVFQTKRKTFKVELVDAEQMDDFRSNNSSLASLAALASLVSLVFYALSLAGQRSLRN